MSIELVSRSLDLEIDPVTKGNGKRKTIDSDNKDAMKMIKTNRQGVWHELRKLQKKHKKDVNDKRKKRKMKSAIEKYQEEHAQDHTEANVEALLRITELGKVGEQVAEKILNKQPCQLSRNLPEEVKEESSSIFTEEDFRKFEKDYRRK